MPEIARALPLTFIGERNKGRIVERVSRRRRHGSLGPNCEVKILRIATATEGGGKGGGDGRQSRGWGGVGG